jgi:uncharacterized protein (UPF0276 family)
MPLDIIHPVCPHDCPSTCALEVERLDARTIGRVRGARGNPYTAGVVCAKVARYAERQHHPDRLAQPLRRVGEKGRGRDAFVPIGWEAALDAVCINVVRAQEFLGRQILVENVSSYLQFSDSTIPEWEFVGEVARRTGCGLLLDVNNIYVSAVNHGFDALHYLDAIPAHAVREIHLAGFDSNGMCLIDTHGKPVAGPVWNLYGEALTRFGPVPTLIEWDTDLPPLVVLLQEAAKAQEILNQWTMETTHALAA